MNNFVLKRLLKTRPARAGPHWKKHKFKVLRWFLSSKLMFSSAGGITPSLHAPASIRPPSFPSPPPHLLQSGARLQEQVLPVLHLMEVGVFGRGLPGCCVRHDGVFLRAESDRGRRGVRRVTGREQEEEQRESGGSPCSVMWRPAGNQRDMGQEEVSLRSDFLGSFARKIFLGSEKTNKHNYRFIYLILVCQINVH